MSSAKALGLVAPFVGFVLAPLLAAGCGPSTPANAPAKSPEQYEEETAPASEAAGAPADQSMSPRAPAPPAAGAAAPSSSKMEGERAAPDMDALARQLDNALTLSTPDCTTAWALRDRICDLAQRLCDIAGRSAEPEVAERCTDGRARCERATARVRAGCAD